MQILAPMLFLSIYSYNVILILVENNRNHIFLYYYFKHNKTQRVKVFQSQAVYPFFFLGEHIYITCSL